MYKNLSFTDLEIAHCLEILPIVAPNMAKNNVRWDADKKFFYDDNGIIIPAFNFVYDVIVHKYVTNHLFNGTLKDVRSQNHAITAFVYRLCQTNVNGTHLLKNAIYVIYKAVTQSSKS